MPHSNPAPKATTPPPGRPAGTTTARDRRLRAKLNPDAELAGLAPGTWLLFGLEDLHRSELRNGHNGSVGRQPRQDHVPQVSHSPVSFQIWNHQLRFSVIRCE